MRSRLQTLFGVDLPIIQAPMAGVQDSALPLAVSNAGGLGVLACAMLDHQTCASQLESMRAGTDKPFGVNFFSHVASDPDPEQAHAWRTRFGSYYREFDVPQPDIPRTASRLPFDVKMAELVERFRPAMVSFHFGLPDNELLQRVRRTGARIISSATTVQEAQWLERQGVDAIIAQGFEAGGHRGMFLTQDLDTQMGTIALVSQVLKAVKLPVIAAGGIADAAGVRAVLELGAVAAQVGTAYLLCPEATTSPLHRRALATAHERHTALTNVFTGRPARGIVNRLVAELGPISSHAPAFPHAVFASSTLRAKAEAQGKDDFSPLWCGQNATGCKEVPAAELTRELASRL